MHHVISSAEKHHHDIISSCLNLLDDTLNIKSWATCKCKCKCIMQKKGSNIDVVRARHVLALSLNIAISKVLPSRKLVSIGQLLSIFACKWSSSNIINNRWDWEGLRWRIKELTCEIVAAWYKICLVYDTYWTLVTFYCCIWFYWIVCQLLHYKVVS